MIHTKNLLLDIQNFIMDPINDLLHLHPILLVLCLTRSLVRQGFQICFQLVQSLQMTRNLPMPPSVKNHDCQLPLFLSSSNLGYSGCLPFQSKSAAPQQKPTSSCSQRYTLSRGSSIRRWKQYRNRTRNPVHHLEQILQVDGSWVYQRR